MRRASGPSNVLIVSNHEGALASSRTYREARCRSRCGHTGPNASIWPFLRGARASPFIVIGEEADRDVDAWSDFFLPAFLPAETDRLGTARA